MFCSNIVHKGLSKSMEMKAVGKKRVAVSVSLLQSHIGFRLS